MAYKDPLKRKEYRHQYYLENKDHTLKINKEWEERNKEKRSKRRKELYQEKLGNLEEVEKRRNNYKKFESSFVKYDTWFEKLEPYYKDELRRDPDNPELLQVKCKYDGRYFNPTYAQIRRRWRAIMGSYTSGRTHGEANLYCSESCKHACPSYGQLKYPKGFKQATSREVQPELRKMVLERDNWTCQKEGCGKSKDEYPELELHCHHIFPLNEDPIESADMDNCITLCKECHHWVHENIPGCGYSELRCNKEK